MPIDYEDRPFLFVPHDWAEILELRMEYDLGILQIGFGAEKYDANQADVVHVLDVLLALPGMNQIAAVLALLDQVKGPLRGFWLASNADDMDITASVSATKVRIKHQGLSDSWEDHPAQCLLFLKDGESPMTAWMEDVTEIDANTEEVTLHEVLPQAPDETWQVHRCLFVRLAKDEIEIDFSAEQYGLARLRVVELPREYPDESVAFDEIAVFLYHLWIDHRGTLEHWYLTSFAAGVESNSQAYTFAPITHGGLKYGLQLAESTVDLDAVFGAGTPLDKFVPFTLERTLHIEIKQTTLADPDTVTTLFVGEVRNAKAKGKRITAKCASLFARLSRRIPWALIQPRCNNVLGDVNCTFDRDVVVATKTTATGPVNGTIASIDGRTITVDSGDIAGYDDNCWLPGGLIFVGTGTALQTRTILTKEKLDTDTHRYLLDRELIGVTVGATVKAWTGCDGRYQTCRDCFHGDDWPLFFYGTPHVPDENPSVKGVNAKNPAGGKK